MKNYSEKEKAVPRRSTVDEDGKYSYLLTECKNWIYCLDGSYMKYNNCICPKCGKTILIQQPQPG